MSKSSSLLSAATAVAVLGVVGIAYAQSYNDPAKRSNTPMQSQSTSGQQSVPSDSPLAPTGAGSGSDGMNTPTATETNSNAPLTERAARADRN